MNNLLSYCGLIDAKKEFLTKIYLYRVTILGAAAVGKSSLTSQFLSSDHMNTYDTVGK